MSSIPIITIYTHRKQSWNWRICRYMYIWNMQPISRLSRKIRTNTYQLEYYYSLCSFQHLIPFYIYSFSDLFLALLLANKTCISLSQLSAAEQFNMNVAVRQIWHFLCFSFRYTRIHFTLPTVSRHSALHRVLSLSSSTPVYYILIQMSIYSAKTYLYACFIVYGTRPCSSARARALSYDRQSRHSK